mmetsp:Transcript_118291/g.381826  ORF Transcript_118291/g.381826 Transcript_118291/m.381826 type:complete len:1124 (+) Transcript_118291:91-3462(+)
MAAVDAGKLAELLRALSSSQNAERQQAEKLYQQAKAAEPDNLVIGLLAVVANQSVDMAVRKHGAVLARQLVAQGPEKDFAFARMAPQNRQEVANGLLQLFENEADSKLQRKVGDVVAKLADATCDAKDQRGWLAPGQRGWPALLPMAFRLADASSATSTTRCECALRLLKDLVSTLQEEVVGAQQQLGAVLQNAFANQDVKIRCAALLLVCEIVGAVDKKDWAPLLATATVMNQVLEHAAQANMQDELSECLQALVEVASIEPDFFKQRLTAALEPAKFLSTVVKAREGVESGSRGLALEWLVSYAEKKPKWLAKSLPAFAPLAIECCMDLMLEVEDDEGELEAWAARMDDEEGEEDADELFHTGEEAIDRVVEAVQMEGLGNSLFSIIARYANEDAWQAKHAALAAIKQTVEYVEERAHVDAMANLLLQHVDHPHPRVRFTALHALGQLANDQSPHFQESKHQTVMPVLLQKMDDGVDRVAAMAMSAFVSFGEELDNSLMIQYAQGFMEKLCAKLQATQHRGVREESITSIAVIAGVIEKDFSRYYDSIMPMLKQFVMHAKGEKENRLRGKSFECMSLLGIAVGKEKFLPDAGEAIAEMMNTPLEADDVQREYIKEASERICQCLKKDFAPFLPNLLLGIFKTLKMDESEAPTPQRAGAEEDDDEEDAYVQVSTGDGKLVRVRTQRFEEMMQSVQLLHTFATEMEGAFFDWVPPTAEALLPLLSAADELACYCDEVRGVAFQTWGLLIKSARAGAQERGQTPELAGKLLRTGLQHTFGLLEKEQEAETLAETASGVSECIKNVGSGILNAEEVGQLVGRMLALMDQSFERSKVAEKMKEDHKAASKLPGLGDDEDDDDDNQDEEEQLRRNYEEVLGAIMEVAPAEFLPCLPQCAERLRVWIATPQNKVLGLYLSCDLIAHIKEQSEPVWPVFMPEVFRALGEQDADARTAAAYAINLAAPLASFAEAAPEAFRRLAALVSAPRPKRNKTDEKARLAADNAVAALFTLSKEKPDLCPPEIQAWSAVLSRLPLKEDEEEAKKVHETVAGLVLEQHAGLLGPAEAHLGKVLSALAEVYKQEEFCTKDTDKKILKVFQLLPRERLQALAGSFAEKQQKKIEKMLVG